MIPFKHIVFLTVATLYSGFTAAQDDYSLKPPRDYEKKPAKTAGFIELAGNAGLYSLNIDRIYYYREKFKMSARAGFAPHFNSIYMEQIYVLENNFILFKNPHHLELGLGASIQRRYNERPNEVDHYFWETLVFGTGRLGYRYQKQDDGFFLRAAVTPVVMSNDALGFHGDYFQFWGGVSVGVSF